MITFCCGGLPEATPLLDNASSESLKMPYFLLNKPEDNPQPVTIEEGTDDQVEVHGYCRSQCKTVIFYIAAAMTLGLLLLVARWKPAWAVWLTCTPCSVATASVLVVRDGHGTKNVLRVHVQSVAATLPPELVYSRSLSSISSHQQDSMNFNYSPASFYRHFVHNCVKYVWDSRQSCFKRLRGYDQGILCSEFYENFHGLLAVEEEQKMQIYGPNMIDIEVKSYFRLFIDEVLNPFYIFQVASVILWAMDNYIYYACCILVISMVSIAISLYETKKQRITLRDMVSHSNAVTVTVCRQDGVFEDIPAANLVPGDIIVIPPHGCLMACDAVLIAGNCIVNESMLTGESIPETKTPLIKQDDEIYSPQTHKRHTLFCGTQVIQTRYYENNRVLAVVVRTGFSTAKGELVRSILFPKPLGFKFYRDSVRFVVLLFCISAVGMAYSIYCYIIRDSKISETIIRALDIITIVVPPALPAAMTIGTVYAQNRLKKQGIFCISPPRINIGGKLKLICFDKTGTLTEEGLDFWGVIPTSNGRFEDLEKNGELLPNDSPLKATMACCHSLTVIDEELRGDPLDLKMFLATKWEMEEPGADNTKYDLLNPTVIRPPRVRSEGPDLSSDNMMIHEPGVEQIMSFQMSPTKDSKDLSLDSEIPFEIGIIRQFPFSSGLQRMSVICRTLGAKQMDLYCKGAPEKISSLCLPNTVPGTFPELLKDYTLQGFRVIALAWKKLDPKLSWHHAQKIKREQVEVDLNFLGLLIMQNTLKPETTPVIKVLHDAQIRSVMVTGDNLLTAVSVARDCHMISETHKVIVVKGFPPDHNQPASICFEVAETPNIANTHSFPEITPNGVGYCEINHQNETAKMKPFHFVLDGKAFGIVRTYFPELLPKIIVRGAVFARMAPEQKTQLVESLQELGYIVGMCGDGANDCGALKAADVGISLSEAEASVAAPFTSNIPNIRCVPIVIREGRCALVTSFSTFKFIALYSLTQFITVLILYTVDTNLTDQMFLYIDLPVITLLAIVMGYTGAYEKLIPSRPRSSLVSVSNVSSLLMQITIIGAVQVGALIFLQHQTWYKPVVTHDTIMASWENSTIFLVSCYQYIAIALIVSDGPPYRKSFYTNLYYLLSLIVLLAFTTLLLFNPFPQLADFLSIIRWQPNDHFTFRLTLLLGVGCNFFFALILENFICKSDWLKKLVRILKNKKEPKNEYKRIEKEITLDSQWPCMDRPIYSTGPIIVVQ